MRVLPILKACYGAVSTELALESLKAAQLAFNAKNTTSARATAETTLPVCEKLNLSDDASILRALLAALPAS
jgi:hypothetical protein